MKMQLMKNMQEITYNHEPYLFNGLVCQLTSTLMKAIYIYY